MKTTKDPRHRKRRATVKELFAQSFIKQKANVYANEVLSKQSDIDKLIKRAAPEWPVDKISKIDLAILRLAVYELTIERKEPPKVIIDEAVELAKEYGSETSPKFVNGVLGTIFSWETKKNT